MNRFMVTASPHIHEGKTVSRIMLDVIIALVPALVASVIIFGPRALAVTAVTVAACVLGEYVARKVMKRSSTISDLSAVVTGILLAFNLPVSIPLWMAALGGFIATIVIKQMFGGIGHNFVNPAIGARIVLLLSFTSYMSTWVEPFYYKTVSAADAVTAATTLGGGDVPSMMNMFLGARGGSLGETCIAALLVGGIYLVARRVISPVIPLCFMGTTVLITALAGGDPLIQFMSGGLVLGAVFMATDYSTSPMNVKGKVIFGVGCGLITAVIRLFASLPEGVSYSILIMNVLVPHIENLTIPKAFGQKEVESK